jgi:hypothetical protein
MKPIFKYLLLLCLAASGHGASHACGSMCITMAGNQQFTTFRTHIDQSMFDKNMNKRRDENNAPPRKTDGAVSTQDITAKVSYQPDPRISEQVKAQVVDELIAELRKRGRHTADNENALRSALAKIEITDVFAPELKRFGLAPNNTAAAFTAFTSLGFAILNNKNEYPPAQNKALYKQISQALTATRSRSSDTEKQKFAESMYWVAYMNTLDYGNATKGTPGYTIANVKESVTQSMKQFRVNPNEMKFGDNGLEAVR